MYVDGSMMIFASLQLPKNVSLVNHAWQEGLVSSDGRFRFHALTGANVQSFGTLDFQSGNILSKSVGGKLMLRIVSNFLVFFFFNKKSLFKYLLLNLSDVFFSSLNYESMVCFKCFHSASLT